MILEALAILSLSMVPPLEPFDGSPRAHELAGQFMDSSQLTEPKPLLPGRTGPHTQDVRFPHPVSEARFIGIEAAEEERGFIRHPVVMGLAAGAVLGAGLAAWSPREEGDTSPYLYFVPIGAAMGGFLGYLYDNRPSDPIPLGAMR